MEKKLSPWNEKKSTTKVIENVVRHVIYSVLKVKQRQFSLLIKLMYSFSLDAINIY